MLKYPLKKPDTDYRGRVYLIGDGIDEREILIRRRAASSRRLS
jgi:hypothetical protein